MGSFPKLLGLLFMLQIDIIQGGDVNCFINGREYQCGNQDYSKNCVKFDCHCDGRWVTKTRYNPLCSECSVRNDPHFTTFDGARYDWHGDCTYVLAEEEGGVSYVYNRFTKCGIASCVDDVTFKPRNGPIIRIHNSQTVLSYGSPYDAEVVINGFTQQITDKGREMQVLKGPENIEHPVLAYYLGGCLHIIAIDQQDFLVKICRGSVRVFSATKKFSDKNIYGMCGSPDDGHPDDDLRLRDGTVVENPDGCCFDHIIDSSFAESWEVRGAPCDDPYHGRRRRSIAQKTGKKLCGASDEQKSDYYSVCKELIEKDNSLVEEKKKEFIDNCAFDQCIITQAGANTNTIKEWLNQYNNLVEQEVFEQQHQDAISEEDYEYFDYLDDYYDEQENNIPDQPGNEQTTTPAPVCVSPWVLIGNGNGCFLFVQNKVVWDSARANCQAYGGDLVILDTEDKRIAMVDYMEISGLKNIGSFWLGSNDRSGSWLWLNGNPLTDGWKVGQEPDDDAGDDTCAYIYTRPYPSGRYDLLFDISCTYYWNYICEK